MKELRVQNILVPIDFSEISISAIPVAKGLAQRFGSAVHLVHVQEPYYPAMYYGVGAPAPIAFVNAVEEAREKAGAQLETLAKKYDLAGKALSVVGAPVFDEICSIARRIPADLIVTPTHGNTGLPHLLLGSTAERLVQHAPCPIFVIRPGKRLGVFQKTGSYVPRINTILVPVDFSACSLVGLQYAVQFARKFAAKIVVLHVVDVAPSLAADTYGVYELGRYAELAQTSAEEKFPPFLRSVRFGEVKFETRIVHGRSADAICAAATKENANVIVTATHGRTGLPHLLVGSTAEVIVRYAPCPVLVVPSHPTARQKMLQARTKQSSQLARPPIRTKRAMKQTPLESERFNKRFRKTVAQPFPERRMTNKFRESHKEAS